MSWDRKRAALALVGVLIAWGVVTFFSGGYVTVASAVLLGIVRAKA